MANWKLACPFAKIPEDEPLGVTIGNRRIAVYKVEGQVFATDNVCSHAYALLSTGFLDGHTIECPLHGGKFDVRSGYCVNEDYDDLELFGTEVRDEDVYIDMKGDT